MKQLHYTYSPDSTSITLHHHTGTKTTISLSNEIIKKLNAHAQTVPDPKQFKKLQELNEDLLKRYQFVHAQKFNTNVRKSNIEKILKNEEMRIQLLKNIE